MKTGATIITTAALDYSVSQFQYTAVVSSICGDYSSSTFQNQDINFFSHYFSFQKNEIAEYLSENKSISIYVNDFVKKLSSEGFFWSGELRLSEKTGNPTKLIIIYRPILNNSTSVILLENSANNYHNQKIYSKLLKDLFKRTKDVKNSIIIDEQLL